MCGKMQKSGLLDIVPLICTQFFGQLNILAIVKPKGDLVAKFERFLGPSVDRVQFRKFVHPAVVRLFSLEILQTIATIQDPNRITLKCRRMAAFSL